MNEKHFGLATRHLSGNLLKWKWLEAMRNLLNKFGGRDLHENYAQLAFDQVGLTLILARASNPSSPL